MTHDAAFTRFPALTTNRLQLRQLRPTDAEALYAMKSDPEVTKHYGQEPHQSLDDTRAWIQRLADSYVRRDSLVWCLTFKGQDTAIGTCVFWNFDSSFHTAEIGYEFHPAYWQQGIMAEALPALVDYGFREMGLNRVEATPFDENAASKSLLLRLGFKLEGNLRQRHFFRGRFLDQLYYGLLKEDWLKSA